MASHAEVRGAKEMKKDFSPFYSFRGYQEVYSGARGGNKKKDYSAHSLLRLKVLKVELLSEP